MKNQEFLQLDFGLEFEKRKQERPLPPKKSKSNFVFDMMDCLTSPIIVFQCAWLDTIPQDLRSNIPLSRMIACREQNEMATIPEVVAYLMPRSFEAPMPSVWANIYTWAGLQYALQFRSIDQQEIMRGIAPKELNRDERREMNHLRRWIYDKRRKALKDRMKASEEPTQKVESQQTKLL